MGEKVAVKPREGGILWIQGIESRFDIMFDEGSGASVILLSFRY